MSLAREATLRIMFFIAADNFQGMKTRNENFLRHAHNFTRIDSNCCLAFCRKDSEVNQLINWESSINQSNRDFSICLNIYHKAWIFNSRTRYI